eukprot:1306944-Rhodomonas_salina.1
MRGGAANTHGNPSQYPSSIAEAGPLGASTTATHARSRSQTLSCVCSDAQPAESGLARGKHRFV